MTQVTNVLSCSVIFLLPALLLVHDLVSSLASIEYFSFCLGGGTVTRSLSLCTTVILQHSVASALLADGVACMIASFPLRS